MSKKYSIGIILLRLALAFVFLWFGFSQLSDAVRWVAFVPDWATKFMSAGTLVILNGLFEVMAGALLALNVYAQYVALLLGIHLFVIATSLGLNATGVRDIGLSLATISLFFLSGAQKESLPSSPATSEPFTPSVIRPRPRV